jgi:hypothetical protein
MANVKEVEENSIAPDGFVSEDEDALGDPSDSAVDCRMYVVIIDAWMKLTSPSALADVEADHSPSLVGATLRHA